MNTAIKVARDMLQILKAELPSLTAVPLKLQHVVEIISEKQKENQVRPWRDASRPQIFPLTSNGINTIHNHK